MHRIVFTLLYVVACSTGLAAQPLRGAGGPELRALSLSDAVELASRGNFDLRLAEYEKQSAEADFHKTLSVILPRLSASEIFVSTQDPLGVFGLKLRQSDVSVADFNPVTLNAPSTRQNFTTKIEVRQPLLNVDGFFGRYAAGKSAEAAGFRVERARHGVELATKSAYFQLVLARESRGVIRDALRAAEAYRTQAKDFYDQGLIQRSDYLMTDVRVLDLTRAGAEADNAIARAENGLRLLLGLADAVGVEPTDTLAFAPLDSVVYDIEQVNAGRSDMKAMRAGLDALGGMSNMARSGFLPTINAFADYEWNSLHLSATQGKAWTVGAVAQWNIFSGFDQVGDIEKSAARRSGMEAEYAKLVVENAGELRVASGTLATSRHLVDLSRAMEAQSAEQLRITEERYATGLERTSDLLQAEAAHSNARLKYLEAVFQHTVAGYTMEFLLERKVAK